MKIIIGQSLISLFPMTMTNRLEYHSVKSVGILSLSGPYFPTFGLNTESYGVSLRIQSECRKYGPQALRIRTLLTKCI